MNKRYNLETRLLLFSQNVIAFSQEIKITLYNRNIISQLLRSSTSIGANYTEANDALGKKDFLHRLRIARKEAKESLYWLQLLLTTNPQSVDKINPLIDECTQLRNILSAIINKSK